MTQSLSILHLFSHFDPASATHRATRLMAAFGDRARHTIVSAAAGRHSAVAGIAPGVRFVLAQDPPPLSGGPSVARYEAIARFMRGFDLVLTYDAGAIDGAMARRVFGRGAPPLVHHEDGVEAEEVAGRQPQRTLYRRLALSAAQALVVPSARLEDIALRLWRQPRARVHRIGNAIAVAPFAAAPDPRAIPGFVRKERELVIGAVGGLRREANLPALVRAAGGLSARFRLVIVGEGPDRGAIEQAALAMGIDDRVVLPGRLAAPERYMGLFDLLALSAARADFPVGVVRAMAAGLPVATTPVGDVRELLAAENLPFVTPHHSEVRLRDAMQELADDPALRARVGAANRAKAAATHDEGAMIARYAALYAAVAGRPGCLG